MQKRSKIEKSEKSWVAVLMLTCISSPALGESLFPLGLEHNKWLEFRCEGYSATVSGVIFGPEKPPCCGVPLGGIGTGCLDIEVSGVLGFETLFNQFPRRPQLLTPFLGMTAGGKSYVLSDRKYIDGGTMLGCVEPTADPEPSRSTLVKFDGVESVNKIHYFGHFPIVDIEYEIEGPVRVSLRAWSPFIPGDAAASNVPAAVFEVWLHNQTEAEQEGTIAVSFPGFPPVKRLHQGEHTYQRKQLEDPVRGVEIEGPNGIGYVLGVIGDERVRTGAGLSSNGAAWKKVAAQLPEASVASSGASVAVDFRLPGGQRRVSRFLLAWYSPTFWGDPTQTQKEEGYTNYYAHQYKDAVEVARRMAAEHKSLLRRILAWQDAIYTDRTLPVWLRDGLVNVLHLIPETSYWAFPNPPLDWSHPDGLFSMNESPRGCPHIACIPCDWYGNIPIVYFFPRLARSMVLGHSHYMREDGAPPFEWGGAGLIAWRSPSYENQKSLNGFCFVSMVDRLWQCTEDANVLREFYPYVKKSTRYTVAMNQGPEAVIRMPEDRKDEWWEGFDWLGMTAHAGGLRISNMYLAERMATAMGDREFADQCREWIRQGQSSLEEKMWNEKTGSYLLWYDPRIEKLNDSIMANQLDGEWNNRFHGLSGLFQRDRVDTVLKTVEQSCLGPLGAPSFGKFGVVSFAKPDKTPLVTYGIFVPEIMMLGFTYLYEGDRITGLRVLQECMDNLVIKHGHGWDYPSSISGKPIHTKQGEYGREGIEVQFEGFGDGQRTHGTDYYQGMILWAAPAALHRLDQTGPTRPGGLVDRVMRAARKQ